MMNSSDPVRFLLVSWAIPPTASGSSIVIRNLASQFTLKEVVLLGQVPFKGRIDLQGIEGHKRIVIPSLAIYWRVKPWVEPFYAIPLAVYSGCVAVRRYNLRAIVAVFPNISFLVAGYLIAVIMELPFLPYFHNLYIETRKNKIEVFIAKLVQKKIMRRAACVFSMSAGMARYFDSQYKQFTIPLVHSLCKPIPVKTEIQNSKVPFKIGVSGNINPGSERAIRNVIRAIGGNSSYQLILHTPVSASHARERLGVWADNIIVRDEQNTDSLVNSLGQCDLLVLGLYNDWGNMYEDDCATQFPTRALEMLISGKPILVLCPSHYFLAEFFNSKKCGLVLDSEDPLEIREAIAYLCLENNKKAHYVSNSLRVAQDFSGKKVADILRRELISVIKDH